MEHRGNARDGPQIRSHIFPNAAVPTRCPTHQTAAPVEQGNPEAVDLRLRHPAKGGARERPAGAGHERPDLLETADAVEREHSHTMLDALERPRWRSGDSLGRAVGRDQFRGGSLELDQLVHQRVVFGIRDLGPRLLVVQPVVTGDFLAQASHPPGCGRAVGCSSRLSHQA
jgi:hypothetical protein